MHAGTYVIDRGTFNVGGNVKLSASHVPIFLTSSTGASYATVVIGNGANVTLSATRTVRPRDLLLRQPQRTEHDGRRFRRRRDDEPTGSSIPNAELSSFQNAISNPSGCTQLIAGTMQFVGGSRFQPVHRVRGIGGGVSQPVE